MIDQVLGITIQALILLENQTIQEAKMEGQIDRLDPLNLERTIDERLANMLAPLQASTKHVTRLAQLQDAALVGNVPSLLNLLQEDPHILDRCTIDHKGDFIKSPLHVAANAGHQEFVTQILWHKPELGKEVEQLKGSSPLHVASEKGHLEIVKTLLEVNLNSWFVRDRDGRIPVHVAAINGHIHVLEELIRAMPLAAMEKTNDGETVLHLCVKSNQPEALKFLINVTNDDELLNSKDNGGNTILHLAVAAKQLEIVKIILEKKERMDKNAMNKNGLTAMDTCYRSRKKDVNNKEIWKSLKRAKALQAKNIINKHADWLEKRCSALMVAASLIATMAFQVGINPPGGVWQDDDNGQKAGVSILSHVEEGRFNLLMIYNTIALVASLSVVLLLISGLPCKRRFNLGILMITMWIAVSATAFTYMASIVIVANVPWITDFRQNKLSPVYVAILICLYFWLFSIIITVLLGNAIRIIVKLVKKLWKRCYQRNTTSHPPV